MCVYLMRRCGIIIRCIINYYNDCLITLTEVHQQINNLNDVLIMVIKYYYNQLSANSNQTRTDNIDQLIAHYNTSKKHLDETKVYTCTCTCTVEPHYTYCTRISEVGGFLGRFLM